MPRQSHDARGSLVETMHYPWAIAATALGKSFPIAVQQAVDQRFLMLPRSPVYHEPCRLVDDGEIIVFIYDIKVESLRSRLISRGLSRQKNGDLLAAFD
tara:strand:- start:202 stop:498 length:297 start_codon:yes stop_codon:yes gene_type:complete